MARMPFEAATGLPSTECMVHLYSVFSASRLASRSGSIADVTGIMVNSGTMMKAKCCGHSWGLSPNM